MDMYTIELVKGKWYGEWPGVDDPELVKLIRSMPQLKDVLFHESPEGRPMVSIPRDEVSIGRGQVADILISEPCVTRRHCYLRKRNGDVYLDDIGARHPTFIIREGESQEVERGAQVRVHAGDILRFGGVEIKLVEL